MKTNKTVKQALTLLAAMTLTIIGAARANAGNVLNTFVDDTEVVTDECSGENIIVTGRIHIQANKTTTPDGNIHIHLTENGADIQGVGQTTGTKYQIPFDFTETDNLHAGETSTKEETRNLISAGALSNEKLKMLVHITVNANGDITVMNEFLKVVCTP